MYPLPRLTYCQHFTFACFMVLSLPPSPSKHAQLFPCSQRRAHWFTSHAGGSLGSWSRSRQLRCPSWCWKEQRWALPQTADCELNKYAVISQWVLGCLLHSSRNGHRYCRVWDGTWSPDALGTCGYYGPVGLLHVQQDQSPPMQERGSWELTHQGLVFCRRMQKTNGRGKFKSWQCWSHGF